MSGRTKSNILMSCLFFVVLISDQLTKWLVVSNLDVGDFFKVTSFFNIVRVHNSGITFGMFKEIAQPLILATISIIVIISLVVYAKQNKPFRYPIIAIIAGAIGNVIDRFYYRSVVDFLDFHVNQCHWPAFNIADSAIVIGVCCLIFISYTNEEVKK